MLHPDDLHLTNDLLPPDVREAMRTRSRERGRTMRIGIVGGGLVGHSTARAFMEHAEVRVYDTVPERRTHPLADVLECDIVFVALPSPQKADSLACDLSIIEDFFASVKGHQTNLVLRSTVPIGTTKRLREQYGLSNLVHSPEFVTARAAVVDAQTPARNIVGGVPGPGGCACEELLESLYRKRFPGVPVLRMTSDESEAVKLGLNGFFAQKVIYFTHLWLLARQHGLDWSRVIGGILSDGRVAHAHTQVPGQAGRLGAGGACLNKDLSNLVQCFQDAGVPAEFLRAAQADNMKLLAMNGAGRGS
jgi:UDPglucose 6-dehydrogenase